MHYLPLTLLSESYYTVGLNSRWTRRIPNVQATKSIRHRRPIEGRVRESVRGVRAPVVSAAGARALVLGVRAGARGEGRVRRRPVAVLRVSYL